MMDKLSVYTYVDVLFQAYDKPDYTQAPSNSIV